MNKNKLTGLLITIIVIVLVIIVSGTFNGGTEPDEIYNATTEPSAGQVSNDEYINYTFRNSRLLSEHYEKHGIDMGFETEEAYERAASDVANDPDSLHKLEKEDGDDVYYKEETNEFVIISRDGFIRTYFLPDSGKKYFDKQ